MPPPLPHPHSFRVRSCSGSKWVGTRELPVCQHLPWPLLPSVIPSSQPRVTGCVQPPREPTAGWQATRGAMCSHSQSDQHILSGVPVCHPAVPPCDPKHSAHCLPDPLSCHCLPPLTPPCALPFPGGNKPKHPCPGPWPLRVAVPFTLKSERGGDLPQVTQAKIQSPGPPLHYSSPS